MLEGANEKKIAEKANFACLYDNGLLFYEEAEGGELLYTDLESVTKTVGGKCYLNIGSDFGSFVFFGKEIDIDGKKLFENYIIRLDRTIEMSQIGFSFFLENKYYSLKRRKGLVFCYSNLQGTIAWQMDLSQVGPYIKMDGTAAEANEIDGDLMGSEEYGLIYVPMAGGQLVALDAGSGEVRWVNSTDWNGRYGMFKECIFKVSDKLYKVDARTGEILLQRDFREIIDMDFVPSGPVWVYSDLLLLLDTRGAIVVMVDTATLSYINHVHIESVPGIAHSRNVLDWQNGKLYVLDIGRTLHVFEP